MSHVNVIVRHSPQGELGGILSTIGAIAGASAGQAAGALKLPGWAQAAIGVGGNVAAGLLSQPQTGGPDCKKHSVECIDALVTQYGQQMSNAAAQGATPDQLVQIVQAYLGAFSDGNVFKQDGSDAYLENTKNQLQQKISELRSAPVLVDTSGGTNSLPSSSSSDAIGGISTSTLLLIGGVIAIGFLMD